MTRAEDGGAVFEVRLRLADGGSGDPGAGTVPAQGGSVEDAVAVRGDV